MNDKCTHGWTGENGITGEYSYLTASIVSKEMKLPIISIHCPVGNIMSSKVLSLLQSIITILPNINLVLFNRRFYSKDIIVKLSTLPVLY